MAGKRVLSVGQCYADNSSITRALRQHFSADVVPADSADEVLSRLRAEAFDLLLVNRILDADGSSGVELIQQLKADKDLQNTPVMLVSNYEDAQQEAVAAGALPGFGKASMGLPPMLSRLKPILG